jgi:hypothetical protein
MKLYMKIDCSYIMTTLPPTTVINLIINITNHTIPHDDNKKDDKDMSALGVFIVLGLLALMMSLGLLVLIKHMCCDSHMGCFPGACNSIRSNQRNFARQYSSDSEDEERWDDDNYYENPTFESKHKLKKLELKETRIDIYLEDIHQQCSICLEKCENDYITTYPCQHHFHEECIKKWNDTSKSLACPNCKQDIKYIYHAYSI